MARWTAADIPPQHGRRVVVTGGNSGLGLETVRAAAAAGASVVLASRSVERGATARADVLASVPHADVTVQQLDLAELASIRAFAARVAAAGPVDVLVNNAGVMAIPRAVTADGFERQLGVNHLGHFALTAWLLPALRRAPAARVVAVGSIAHRFGTLDLDDLMGRRRYSPGGAYGQSKLANLLFTRQLDRWFRDNGLPARAMAGHPGYSATELLGTSAAHRADPVEAFVFRVANRLAAQPAALGALAQLRAAFDPEAEGDDYFGPRGPFQLRGYPVRVGRSRAARDPALADGLWAASEALTGATFTA